jgi:hypothetical protein
MKTFNRITNVTDNIIHISVQEKLERACLEDRILKMIPKYQPKGKINLGKPLKSWKDSVV